MQTSLYFQQTHGGRLNQLLTSLICFSLLGFLITSSHLQLWAATHGEWGCGAGWGERGGAIAEMSDSVY